MFISDKNLLPYCTFIKDNKFTYTDTDTITCLKKLCHSADRLNFACKTAAMLLAQNDTAPLKIPASLMIDS
jgi:hypothetical protein